MTVLFLLLTLFAEVLMPDPQSVSDCQPPVGPRAAWSVWADPETYEVWLADTRGVRRLAQMPIEPTLTTPALVWEDAGHLRYSTMSHGGNLTVRQAWRINLCGAVELTSRSETSP